MCIKENGGVVYFVLNHKVGSRFVSEISVGKYQVVQVVRVLILPHVEK